jgi:hypothetical protein
MIKLRVCRVIQSEAKDLLLCMEIQKPENSKKNSQQPRTVLDPEQISG